MIKRQFLMLSIILLNFTAFAETGVGLILDVTDYYYFLDNESDVNGANILDVELGVSFYLFTASGNDFSLGAYWSAFYESDEDSLDSDIDDESLRDGVGLRFTYNRVLLQSEIFFVGVGPKIGVQYMFNPSGESVDSSYESTILNTSFSVPINLDIYFSDNIFARVFVDAFKASVDIYQLKYTTGYSTYSNYFDVGLSGDYGVNFIYKF